MGQFYIIVSILEIGGRQNYVIIFKNSKDFNFQRISEYLKKNRVFKDKPLSIGLATVIRYIQ